MHDRCDLSTLGECSCIASGVPCKVQAPLDLGTFRGTNHPGPLDGYPEAAWRLNRVIIAIGFALAAFLIIADQSFSRVERAYQMEKV
jgi:hypothetical protein